MSSTIEHASQSATISEASPAAPDSGAQILALNGSAGTALRGLLEVEHGVPLGEDADVEQAVLYLHKASAWSAAADVTIKLAAAEWDAATATWNEQPGVLASSVVVNVPIGGAAGDEIAFDITTLIEEIHAAEDAGTDAYNGLRLSIAAAGDREFYGANVSDPDMQPRLEVEWSVPPDAPASPRPNDGLAVSETKPKLYADFFDDDAEDAVSGIHIQIDDVDTMAGPFYDSGELAHDEPAFDLNAPPVGAPATPVLGAGPHFWRMRLRDTHMRWSDWSDVASFIVVAKGALTLTAPAAIDSPVPVISHDLTGDVQSEVEVLVERLEGGVWQEHYHLPRHLTAVVDHQVPDADFLERGYSYRIAKRVWPETAYEDLPDDRAFYEVELVGEFL